MPQRLFRSDDTSKLAPKYGSGSQGNNTFTTNTTLSSGQFFYNSIITGTVAALVGAVTEAHIPDGTYNLPCKIIQSAGAGSNASVNYEYNNLISALDGVAQFAYPLTRTYVTGAQIVTSGNWVNVTTNTGVVLKVPAWNGSYGGEFYMTGKGEFLQVGTGVVDLNGLGFRGGLANTANNDGGGNGGEGCVGYSGQGGWNPTTGSTGQFPGGGGFGGDPFGAGALGATNYTGAGGGGGAKFAQGDESAGGGGGGGNFHGGGGGGAGTDGNGGGGAGGASNAVGGGNGGLGVNGAGSASGSKATNVSGDGGRGTEGNAKSGGGGGGGANAITNSELRAMHMGGGGGAGGNYWDNTGPALKAGGNGSTGAGCSTIAFPRITLTGGVLTSGVAGGSSAARGGGGGAGAAGDQRYMGQYINLGSNCNANGANGHGPVNGGDGGASSRAIIHADYSNTLSGTTSPTLTSLIDSIYIDSDGAAAFLLLF